MLPSYVALFDSGELASRVERLVAHLHPCSVCQRLCGVDRLNEETGFCRTGRDAVVASACVHRGEEPPLSGTRGSGTVFFAHCNLRCVFCQNYQISQGWPVGAMGGAETLARVMLDLQQQDCHNINLVSPSHVVPQIVEALLLAVPRGLRLPLVYNTNAYDSVEVLRQLDGVVDIYLPDLKYASDDVAKRFSSGDNYVALSRAAILEMFRQVGDELLLAPDGTALRGLIIRHLVLPGGLAGTRESLAWVAENLSTRVALSLMSQYYPAHRAGEFPVLSRRTTAAEYAESLHVARDLGFERVWVQDSSAAMHYRPDFHSPAHPFESTS
jgi:putative pyruvate formate lyase activating enzyme